MELFYGKASQKVIRQDHSRDHDITMDIIIYRYQVKSKWMKLCLNDWKNYSFCNTLQSP